MKRGALNVCGTCIMHAWFFEFANMSSKVVPSEKIKMSVEYIHLHLAVLSAGKLLNHWAGCVGLDLLIMHV